MHAIALRCGFQRIMRSACVMLCYISTTMQVSVRSLGGGTRPRTRVDIAVPSLAFPGGKDPRCCLVHPFSQQCRAPSVANKCQIRLPQRPIGSILATGGVRDCSENGCSASRWQMSFSLPRCLLDLSRCSQEAVGSMALSQWSGPQFSRALCCHFLLLCFYYCASHKNWIRIIRFIGMHRPLSQ